MKTFVDPLIERKLDSGSYSAERNVPASSMSITSRPMGGAFFQKACELDLVGIVAKRKQSLYRPTVKPSPYWIKIKNPYYSQSEGRQELFER